MNPLLPALHPQVLKWLRSYSQLLRSLQPRADAILHGLCEMFDAYLLHTFLLFSGVSLEELVWYDTKVVNRLRSTLLRILTQDTCKYKAQVGRPGTCWHSTVPCRRRV